MWGRLVTCGPITNRHSSALSNILQPTHCTSRTAVTTLLEPRHGKAKRVTATLKFNVTPLTQSQYFGEGTPENPCGTPASVRFYFQGNTQGKFEFAKFWWSNPVSVQLQALVPGAPVTISVQVNPALWS